MSRKKRVSSQFEAVLRSAARVAELTEAAAIVLIADAAYDFTEVAGILKGRTLLVAAQDEEIREAIAEAELKLIPIEHEPETRVTQVSQVMLDAIADELVDSGDRVVVLYSAFDKDRCDTISIINLSDQLARLTSRDLQRLETQVPLETLRQVVDLACQIGRDGREGRRVGTLFVIGSHRKVMAMSREQVHDPFKGYPRKERMIRDPKVRESIKELAQVDGAFIITSDGVVQAAGRHLNASAENLTLSKGLGSRHWAAAEISKATDAIAIAVSESTGTVRIFMDGKVVLRIEPMGSAMKWHDVDTTPAES